MKLKERTIRVLVSSMLSVCMVFSVIPNVPVKAAGEEESIQRLVSKQQLDDSNANATGQFEYEVRPGMKEWAELNHGERVWACQIPDDILKDMTTEDLVTAVLDYPCFSDMFFYDSYQSGFEVLSNHFNGLQELLKREDAGQYLIDTYKNVNLMELMSISDEYEKFKYSLGVLYLETILAQPEIIETLSNEELAELEGLTEENYEFQINNKDKTASLSYSGYYESLAVQQGISTCDLIGSTVKTPNGSLVQVYSVVNVVDDHYIRRESIKQSI